jgi:hypothetical protein
VPERRAEKEFKGIVNAFITPVDGELRINELLRPPFANALHDNFESFIKTHEEGNFERSSAMAVSIAKFIKTELEDAHYHNPPVKSETRRSAILRTEHTTIVRNPVTPEEKKEMVERLNRLKSHFEEYSSKRE